MSNRRSLNGRELISALSYLGFEVARTSGSHAILKKDGHPAVVTVPVHGNQSLKTGTLNGILRAAGVTYEEMAEHL